MGQKQGRVLWEYGLMWPVWVKVIVHLGEGSGDIDSCHVKIILIVRPNTNNGSVKTRLSYEGRGGHSRLKYPQVMEKYSPSPSDHTRGCNNDEEDEEGGMGTCVF